MHRVQHRLEAKHGVPHAHLDRCPAACRRGGGGGGRGGVGGGPGGQGEASWEGPGACSLALPWCMKAATAAEISILVGEF